MFFNLKAGIVRMLYYNLLIIFLLSTNVTFAAAGLTAKQIVENGNTSGAMACAGCHGSDGAGNNVTGNPRLAGLHADYLSKQLKDFKSGKRDNPLMHNIAKALSDAEIDMLAHYFSELNTSVTTKPTREKLNQQGEKLAVYGNWDNDVPACFRCHGDQAKGGGPAMPSLAGQHENYIETQLQAFKTGARSNDPVGLMTAIASRLSGSEIKAVSAYLANLNPAVK